MIHQEGNNVYGEVEALSVLLGYKTANAGCCKVSEAFGVRACVRVVVVVGGARGRRRLGHQ